jgi:excinuclease UvrABC nuclease subunit
MMKDFPIEKYMDCLYKELLNATPQKIELTLAWYQSFTKGPGVYIFRDLSNIIYVGEANNLRARMDTLRRTVNHTLRRNIGNKIFTHIEGFTKATSKKRFIDTIEEMLDEHIKSKLTLAVFPVPLGRRELEELIIKRHQPEYNIKGKDKQH